MLSGPMIAQATLSWVVDEVWRDIHWPGFCTDDVLICAKTLDEQIPVPKTVVEMVPYYSLKIKLRKNLFVQHSIKQLGEIVDFEVIKVDPEDKKIGKPPTTTSKTQFRSFLVYTDITQILSNIFSWKRHNQTKKLRKYINFYSKN